VDNCAYDITSSSWRAATADRVSGELASPRRRVGRRRFAAIEEQCTRRLHYPNVRTPPRRSISFTGLALYERPWSSAQRAVTTLRAFLLGRSPKTHSSNRFGNCYHLLMRVVNVR
jgi:hypothetical protein